MRDEEKSKEQLLRELRDMRKELRAHKAHATASLRQAAQKLGVSEADLLKSREDLAASREETRACEESLARSNRSLGESQRELREFQLRYNVIGELIPFGVWTSDPQGNVTYLSDAFLDMSGIELGDASLDNWIGRLSPEDVKNSISEWQKNIGKTDIWEREHVVLSKSGKPYTILSRGVPMVNEEDKTISWLGINLDISKRKQLEKQLALAVDKLAGERDRCKEEVRQRTRELRQATERAESASRAKSEFLANMSHEIRTPMNGVLGMTELALMASKEPRAREYLALVKTSGLQLLEIVNGILDLSKIEAGKVELEEVAFDLREELEKVLSPLDVVAHGKGLHLAHVVAPDIPARLAGDPVRLRQVLTNLLGNAVKFTPKGMVSLYVRLANEEATQPGRLRLLFLVQDTGVGIPKDRLENIFESFTQVAGPDHAASGGTGLGLTIGKRLVEMMGGRIWAESEQGRGSTIAFTAEFGLPADEARAAETPKPTLQPMRPLKILLAEDNEINRLVATGMLKSMGHVVDIAENGHEALEALRRERFDLVLMDARMPGLDGVEAARRIRAGEAGDPNVPIVALTAYALKGDREMFLAAGMDDYLSKPFEMEELERVLRQSRTRDREKG